MGWALFWFVPPMFGKPNTFFLLLVAASYPMAAVVRRRGWAARTFAAVTLLTFEGACVMSVVLPLTSKTLVIQETLLGKGGLLPLIASVVAELLERVDRQSV
jgi:hypothetical protein